MPKHTEAWWVCAKCGKLIARVGKKRKKGEQTQDDLMRAHRLECPSPSGQLAGFWMKQVVQEKRDDEEAR